MVTFLGNYAFIWIYDPCYHCRYCFVDAVDDIFTEIEGMSYLRLQYSVDGDDQFREMSVLITVFVWRFRREPD